jgi:hypothetical protein
VSAAGSEPGRASNLASSTLSHIKSCIDLFGTYKYGYNGTTNLPIRPDVAEFIIELFGIFDLTATLPTIDHPDLTLNDDGTVEIAFATFDRELLLTFPCKGVVTYVQGFCHEDATIEGILLFDDDHDVEPSCEKLDSLYIWVKGK